MKILISSIFFVCILCPGFSCADDFLGAPLPPGGKIITQTESRLEKSYDMPYDEVLTFYKTTLQNEKDIKFWDKAEGTRIEEYGTRPWHSITIKRAGQRESNVVVLKDSWTWILGTLLIRFFGVFGILIALYITLSIAGAIQKSFFKSSSKG
ncbi:MAG: hypothetical protein WA974_00710 [Thermodesulfobacteriota bacterium]